MFVLVYLLRTTSNNPTCSDARASLGFLSCSQSTAGRAWCESNWPEQFSDVSESKHVAGPGAKKGGSVSLKPRPRATRLASTHVKRRHIHIETSLLRCPLRVSHPACVTQSARFAHATRRKRLLAGGLYLTDSGTRERRKLM